MAEDTLYSPAAASTPGSADGSNEAGSGAVAVTRYGAPTSSQATASDARSRWTSVAAANVPIVDVAISTISTDPPEPPRVTRRRDSDGTRSRRIAASFDTPSSGTGSRRTAMIPAAMPASAGTTAMNGSTPVSVDVLLEPATPRSTSRYAPRIARTTTKPSNSNRRGDGRRTTAASRPGPRGAAKAVGALAATRTRVVAIATRTAASTVSRAGPAGIRTNAIAVASAAGGRLITKPSMSTARIS